MVSDKIKALREQKGLTQSEVARVLGVTRSCVNAWEMGISIPSTQYIVELALFFNVSCDYLLEVQSSSTVNVEGLNEHEIAIIVELIDCLKNKREP